LRCALAIALLLAALSPLALHALQVYVAFPSAVFYQGRVVVTTGVGNSIAVFAEGEPIFVAWGSAIINASGRLLGISPVFAKPTEVGGAVFDPRLVESYGLESSRGITYVEWSSSPIHLGRSVATITWRGGGNVLSATRCCALVRLWGSMQVYATASEALNELLERSVLIPLASLVPRHVEMYAALRGRIVNTSTLAELARGRFVETPLLIISSGNTTLFLGGALIEYIPGIRAWRLWLGLTIDQNRSVVSNLLLIVARGIPREESLKIASSYASTPNPVEAIRGIWSALAIAPRTKTITLTLTKTATRLIVKELTPLQAATIAIVGVCVGAFIGFSIATVAVKKVLRRE